MSHNISSCTLMKEYTYNIFIISMKIIIIRNKDENTVEMYLNIDMNVLRAVILFPTLKIEGKI